MCAIAGEINYVESFIENSCSYDKKMMATMRKRGPDQDGIYFCENALLLHTRLCVIDIEHGLQPMTAKQGENEFTLVYNGELYNTDEIRRELMEKGFVFNGHSDTEVILNSYIAWGASCVNRLNGIFAFAVWNAKNKKLFFARDRMGVKPFFYYIADKQLVFSSEIKTLLKHPEIKPEIDINSIAEIMLIGPGRTPGYGVFKGILELPPAYCGFFTEKGLDIYRYWQMQDNIHTDSFNTTVKKVRFLVEDSIKRQLISDVPIGTFLSGGLDSSIISSIASKHLAEKGQVLHTFSVFYEDNEKHFKQSSFQPNCDNEFIEIMKTYLGCKNHKIILSTDELADALFVAVDARDLPGMADVDSSLLLFCKEIKKYCTVSLSGECADEIFGGYPWFRDKSIREAKGFPWAQSTSFRADFLKDELCVKINPSDYVYKKYKLTEDDTDLHHTFDFEKRKSKIMINMNMQWFMQTLLDRKDRMSMYSGLEVRVPFCDHRIAEYLYSTPWKFKEYNSYEKGLLREAVKDIIPDEVLWRKKSPYPKTHNPAYLERVTSMLNDIIASQNEPIFDIVKREKLSELTQSTTSTPWYGQLMTVPQTIAYFLQINYWLKKYNITIIE